jgi:hypothetical protein
MSTQRFQDTFGQPLTPGDSVTFLYRKKRYYAKVKAIRTTTIVALLNVIDEAGKTRTLENNRTLADNVITFPVQNLSRLKDT